MMMRKAERPNLKFAKRKVIQHHPMGMGHVSAPALHCHIVIFCRSSVTTWRRLIQGVNKELAIDFRFARHLLKKGLATTKNMRFPILLACLAVLLLLGHPMIHAFSLRPASSVHGHRPANRFGDDSIMTAAAAAAAMDMEDTRNPAATTEKKKSIAAAHQEDDDDDDKVKIITWEPQVAELLRRLEQVSNPTRPFMVALVGIPGSGKSTSAGILQALLGGGGQQEDRGSSSVFIMPMDGFHIPLADLAKRDDDAADVIYRRGAPDTFDVAALQQALHQIAYGKDENSSTVAIVSIPGFDHSVGDPIPNQHTFHRDLHRIVLCEGLYLLHDDNGWQHVKSVFDWTIYIDANIDDCIERLKERNKCIPVRCWK
jgi:pantothenate kinase